MRTPVYSDHQIIEAGKALRRQFPDREVTPSAIRTRLGGGNTTRIRNVWTDYSARFAAASAMQPRDASLTASEAEQALDDTLVVVTDQLRDLVLGLSGAMATGRGTKRVSPFSMDGKNGLISQMAATIEAQAAEIKTLRQALQDCGSKAGG
jgi:hypothetical protein